MLGDYPARALSYLSDTIRAHALPVRKQFQTPSSSKHNESFMLMAVNF
jgi:hypothetical protein